MQEEIDSLNYVFIEAQTFRSMKFPIVIYIYIYIYIYIRSCFDRFEGFHMFYEMVERVKFKRTDAKTTILLASRETSEM